MILAECKQKNWSPHCTMWPKETNYFNTKSRRNVKNFRIKFIKLWC